MAAKYKGTLTNGRAINIESTNLVRFVQNDKDTNIIDFELSKDSTLPDIDFTKANITINYTNTDLDTEECITDIYLVDAPKITVDMIAFSWVVGSNASVYAGICDFQIVITMSDNNDIVMQQWESVINKIPVFKSLENVNITQPKDFVDLTNQIKKYGADVKEKLADAISTKGVKTASTDSFNTMVENIRKISVGKSNTQVVNTSIMMPEVLSRLNHAQVEKNTDGKYEEI